MSKKQVAPERQLNQLLKRRAALDQQLNEIHTQMAAQLAGAPDAIIPVPLDFAAAIQITRSHVFGSVFLTTSQKSINIPTNPQDVYPLPLDPGANDLRVLFSTTEPIWAFGVDLFVNQSRWPVQSVRASQLGGKLSVFWRITVP
jgi:hypothetical protein